ncbi:NRDE family protein [Nocardia sp. Marseille-Q1738]
MCLVLVGWQAHAEYPLIVAANRDEYYWRRSTALVSWPEVPGLMAGRDLESGTDAAGVWIGVRHWGARPRFAAVTNLLGFESSGSPARSRGELPRNFLADKSQPPGEYANRARCAGHGSYNGFSLLVSDLKELWWCSSVGAVDAQPVPPGFHGVANDERLHSLANTAGDPVPETLMSIKTKRALTAFHEVVSADATDVDRYFEVLADRSRPAGNQGTAGATLPGLQRMASANFIATSLYGTRSSTVIMVHESGSCTVTERTFGRNGKPIGTTTLDGRVGSNERTK